MQEKQLGQKFIVDATLYCDFSEAAKSDALKDTVNYAAVYRHLLTFPGSRRIRSCAVQMHANARVLNCIPSCCPDSRSTVRHIAYELGLQVQRSELRLYFCVPGISGWSWRANHAT